MNPRTLRLMIAATALAGLALLFIPSLSLSQEDTAHLVLKKKVGSKDRPSVYIVQRGDNLSTIIRRKLGKPAAAVRVGLPPGAKDSTRRSVMSTASTRARRLPCRDLLPNPGKPIT